MKTLLRLAVLSLGLAVFAWFVHRAGPGEIWQTVSRLGWRAPLIVVPFALVYAIDSLGWHFAFGRDHPHGLKFWSLYRVRWCGEAFNNVVPSAAVGGEALKVYLLHKRGVNPHDAAASVIVGRTIQTLMQVTFIALGSAAFLHVAGHKPGVAPAMATTLTLSTALVVALFWLQSRGVFTLILSWAAKLHIRLRSLEAKRDWLLRIDRQVLSFYRHDRQHFVLCALTYLGGWLMDTTDIYLVSWLLGYPIDWVHAVAIEAFIGVTKLVGFVVPGGIGVQESGIILVCRLAGLPEPLGVAYAIIRRGRDVVFAGIGWLLLYLEEASLQGLRKHVEAEGIPLE